MREWNLVNGDPLSLTLAADSRLGQVDYPDDQIWELVIGNSEPPSLAIQTTYGLRARSMRIFPLFTQINTTRVNPASFYQPPRVSLFFPNYLRLSYSPFTGIDVTTEYWVPTSQSLTCRSRITNSSVIPIQLLVEWAAVLVPLDEGQGMSYTPYQQTTILQGRTANLVPTIMVSGAPGASSGPFPTLGSFLDLAPGGFQYITWAQAALSDSERSTNQAALTLACPWDTEIAHLEMFNTSQIVEIYTGNPEWDAALAFSQKSAFSLIMGPGQGLPHPSFVLNRQPDSGYSPRGDGSDFGYLWNGQPLLQAYFLASLVLPGGAQMIQDIVRNYFSTQDDDGQIDGKPGLAGQRGQFQATPLLSAIAWRAFQCSQDEDFLAEVFPKLSRYISAWFQPAHDRDGDGFPEWDRSIQSGFEENITFNSWYSGGSSSEISTFEAPSLASFIFNEIQCLNKIAKQLNRVDAVRSLDAHTAVLRKAVEATWNPTRAIYQYRDRDTHLSSKGELLAQLKGPGITAIRWSLKKPQRIRVQIVAQDATPLQASLTIDGADVSGACSEVISAKNSPWVSNQISLTTQNVFASVEQVEINGVSPSDSIHIYSVDFSQEDISLFLPLWAHLTHSRRSEGLIKKTILNPDRYFLPYGLSAYPVNRDIPNGSRVSPQINTIWNQLIAEGLLSYGYRKEAASVLTKLMSAAVMSLKKHQSFFHTYNGQTGEISGERHILDGFAPVGLFMDTLGVSIISPETVIINGFNPFSAPVTVKYRGLTVIREDKHAAIIFPDGQTASVSGTGKHRVSLITR